MGGPSDVGQFARSLFGLGGESHLNRLRVFAPPSVSCATSPASPASSASAPAKDADDASDAGDVAHTGEGTSGNEGKCKPK